MAPGSKFGLIWKGCCCWKNAVARLTLPSSESKSVVGNDCCVLKSLLFPSASLISNNDTKQVY